jgi:O-antigen/teichoic acid export membrane protein
LAQHYFVLNISFFNFLKNGGFISGSAIYLLSNIFAAAIPFILLPILTRYLSPVEYGEVGIFLTLIAGLGAFTGLSVHGAANRKFYDDGLEKHNMKDFIGACLQILLASSLLVFAIAWLFQAQLSEWLGLQPHWILWAVIASATGFIFQLRMGQWQVRKQARLYGITQVSQALINTLLSILLVVVFLQGADGRMSAYIISMVAFAILAVFLLYRDNLLGFAWHPSYIKEALAFGVPLMPHVAGIFLLSAVDRLVIDYQLGLAEVGIYMVAVQLASVMGIIFDAINKAYVPWLFERLKRDQPDEKKQIVRLTYAYFLVSLLAAGLVFVVGPITVTVVAGERYAEAGSVIGWLALGQAFSGMYLMVTNYIFYSKKTGLLSLVTIGSGLLNVVLLVVLIKILGLTGAAIAFALSTALRFLFTWLVANRRHPMPWFQA